MQDESDDRFEYTGVNHVALVTDDMAKTVDFYCNVLDMKLIKTFELPNGKGQHFFFDGGNGVGVAFFWYRDAPKAVPGIASRHADRAKFGTLTAHASMNHLAFDVPRDRFDEYVERLRRRGVEYYLINHDDSERGSSNEVNEGTWVRSCYFRDPSGIHLEMAAFTRAFTEKDLNVDPVNAEGKPVPLASILRKAAELAA
jgi:catechol 2,3-dioxygenase-like lactoylglutathione lyase family enzyme